MCGIKCVLGHAIDNENNLAHRGPDDYLIAKLGNCTMEFWRLAINDVTPDGMQPFIKDGHMLVCNGEIFNHKELIEETPKTASDCECLIPFIKKHGIVEAVKKIRGEFAFCITDGTNVQIARDHVGIRPLFYSVTHDNVISFASEAKVLSGTVRVFPPGHVYDSKSDTFTCWYRSSWGVVRTPKPFVRDLIRKAFIDAVKIRVENTERPIGFLLSGGLDSSLVVAVAKQFVRHPIKTFSIGTPNSPDLAAARKVATFLGTEHTEVSFDVHEGIDRLRDVITSLESYDTTTIRASIPMWLLCRHISMKTDCKVILSGEGSDELFGGYLYFHYAKDVETFSLENARRLRLIHQFDGLRADRCIAAHGLELRVPFLDKEFIEVGMTIDQQLKMPVNGVEKWILRDAFQGFLPDDILWRRKDGMSDAVGREWVTTVKQYADKYTWMGNFDALTHNPPLTNEEKMYRRIFWQVFGTENDHLISEIWRPKWTTETDPSAALLNIT
jgi:asparagine synthase (glutamine-hydrolysing)